MRRAKIVYVLSDIHKALAFEWICDVIDKQRFELNFILLSPPGTDMIKYLEVNGIQHTVLDFSGKRDFFKVWWKVFGLLRRLKPKVVHTHLFWANLVALSAAWLLRTPQRIYTRHHSSIHHTYFPRTVWVDRVINFLATDIIAPSEMVKRILVEWEGCSADKVSIVHHGFDLDYFFHTTAERVDTVRDRHRLPTRFPVIGTIARYTEWKGIQYTIRAFEKIRTEFPEAHLMLFNVGGDFEGSIRSMLQELPPGSFSEVSFEADVASVYRLFDVFVHVPVDTYCEAFGQIYVEALAAGVPSVFTLSGIAPDFIADQKNALIVPHKDSVAIAGAIKALISNATLREDLVRGGKDSVRIFSIQNMVMHLEEIYQRQ